jgi:hypothetical protein
LAYRRFVVDPVRNNACRKLDTLVDDSRQMRRQWFCTVCENKFGEAYAGVFLDQLKADPTNSLYDRRLIRFLASVSLRSCLYELDENNPAFRLRKIIAPARKQWEKYLLGEAGTVAPYTLHALVMRDAPTLLVERIGMMVAYPHNLVLTQIGPLVCFGNLGVVPVTEDEIWALGKSMVSDEGGKLPTISLHERNRVLTDGMVEAMDIADIYCGMRARDFALRQARKGSSNGPNR